MHQVPLIGSVGGHLSTFGSQGKMRCIARLMRHTLRIGISRRALFDLKKHRVFVGEGVFAYAQASA